MSPFYLHKERVHLYRATMLRRYSSSEQQASKEQLLHFACLQVAACIWEEA